MKRFGRLLICALALTLFAIGSASAEPWTFGIMADTQWIGADDGQNPNSVAVGIIKQINAQFIEARVKFVIQVGDLVDVFSPSAMQTRASAAQALYDAGIGFYPLRGNHESTQAAATAFQADFPQTQGNGENVFGAAHFSSPSAELAGLSYAFDFRNARFVLLDQFCSPNAPGTACNGFPNAIDTQESWIAGALSARPRGGHAFVFAHKNLIGQNHTDMLFGANPALDPSGQNPFFGSLKQAGVRYVFGGHDHMHHRSIVTSPDGNAKVEEIICASDSSKFYIPKNPSNDFQFDTPTRELPISQELNTIGYYIVTVDGPRVTVDFYSAVANPTLVSGEYLIDKTPTLTFTKRETFGYSLNGQEFVIAEGQPYMGIHDTFGGTQLRILSGVNGSTTVDGSGRSLIKSVNTGWSEGEDAEDNITSNILSLRGMASSLGSGRTDTYTIALSHGHPHFFHFGEAMGSGILVTRDDRGNWVKAVDRNYGGTQHFVMGPWSSGYPLGTYGYDPHTRTAWAVVDHEGEFAIAKNLNDLR